MRLLSASELLRLLLDRLHDLGRQLLDVSPDLFEQRLDRSLQLLHRLGSFDLLHRILLLLALLLLTALNHLEQLLQEREDLLEDPAASLLSLLLLSGIAGLRWSTLRGRCTRLSCGSRVAGRCCLRRSAGSGSAGRRSARCRRSARSSRSRRSGRSRRPGRSRRRTLAARRAQELLHLLVV